MKNDGMTPTKAEPRIDKIEAVKDTRLWSLVRCFNWQHFDLYRDGESMGTVAL